MSRYYTGIGSREAPQWALSLADEIGYAYAQMGYCLRSGGAGGMDEGFEVGAVRWEQQMGVGCREIWVPDLRFRLDEHFDPRYRYAQRADEFEACCHLLRRFKIMTNIKDRPNYIQRLHARNVFQVTGQRNVDMTHYPPLSERVIYWAKMSRRGEPCGGTRTAVLLAKRIGIPTFNLNLKAECDALMKELNLHHNEPW